MRILLFAAFPREFREAVRLIGRGTRIHGLPFRAHSVRLPAHTLTICETGMGVENAGRVFQHMLQAGTFDAAVSLGYCGALSHDASVGDLVWASKVRLIEGERSETLVLPDNGKLLETLSLSLPLRAGTFLTLKEWMKKRELRRFVDPGMTLPVCEMETFELARLSLRHNLTFFAVRAVSDASDVDLPFDPWRVCDSTGTYRPGRAFRLFLTRPRLLRHAMALRRDSSVASRSLAQAVSALLRVLQPGFP